MFSPPPFKESSRPLRRSSSSPHTLSSTGRGRFHSLSSKSTHFSTMDATLNQIHQNPPPISPTHLHSTSNSSFPILAVAVIGILATAILLVAYYIFVIKCCLNWHRFDLLTRFSFSARRRHRPPISLYSPGIQKRGLDESVIQSIPTFEFPALVKDGNFSECAVCLNEFRPGEKLRALPNCGHSFHVDCIDVWLQGNINCPLCRTGISINAHRPPVNQTVSDQISGTDSDENYVVIELERAITPPPPPAIRPPTQPKKLNHVLSMGDEWIDMREKDDRFLVQPMRRSFSMDSASDRLLCLAVQEILQQQGHSRNGDSGSDGAEVNDCDGLHESRVKRSIFSFGHGRGSRNAILPLPNLVP